MATGYLPSSTAQDVSIDPVRYPQNASEQVRTKRAFVLLALTLFLPGAAQTVAGDRKLGRRALRVTFTAWALILAMVVLALVDRSLLVGIFANRWASLAILVGLVAAALGWAFLFLNTLRIIRPPLLPRKVRPVLAAALAALMLVTSGSLGYAAYILNVSRNTFGSIFQAGPAFDPVDGRYNFLLMGGDAGEDRIGRRPDSISVVSVDAKTGETVIFSIPRNFQNAQFPPGSPLNSVYPDGYNCGDECILNSLYPTVAAEYPDLYPGAADPGAEAMMDAASGILGIEVQAYVIVDMAGFSKLVDAMGGITVDAGGWVPITAGEIPGTFPVRHYPPDGWIAPGKQKLDGYHALWYARSREFATDYDRIARQQCVQAAMISQLDPATVLTRFEAIAEAGTQIVETDISRDQLGSFVDLAVKAKGHEVRRMTIGPPDFGTPQDNFVTYPDFDLIHQRVQAKLSVDGQPQAGSTLGHDGGTLTRIGRKGSADAAIGGVPSAGGTEVGGASGIGGGAMAMAAVGRLGNLQLQDAMEGNATDGNAPNGNATDGITEEYLQQLAINGDSATLMTLLADNGECTPG